MTDRQADACDEGSPRLRLVARTELRSRTKATSLPTKNGSGGGGGSAGGGVIIPGVGVGVATATACGARARASRFARDQVALELDRVADRGDDLKLPLNLSSADRPLEIRIRRTRASPRPRSPRP